MVGVAMAPRKPPMGKAKHFGKSEGPSRDGQSKGQSRAPMEFNDKRWDIKNIRKEIELLGSSCMTWKERKDLENRKVVQLGGKPPKNQRLPLSVARPAMKNKKAREEKLLQERIALGRYGGCFGVSTTTRQRQPEKHRPRDSGLRASEGSFRNGVLNVKHLMKKSAPSRDIETDTAPVGPKGKKKGGRQNDKNKNGGRKHHR